MPKISDISINDRFIKALEVPQNTAHKIYWDGKTTGFGVRITQSGAEIYNWKLPNAFGTFCP